MKRWIQAVVTPVGRPGLEEGPVSDHQIVEVVRGRGFLVTLDLDVCVGVQQLRHAPGHRIQLDAGPLAARDHVRWHHAVEVANAEGWLKHAATGEAHAAHHVPHCQDGRWVGVVGVDDAGLHSLPLFGPEVLAQPLVARLPSLLGSRIGPGALKQFLAETTPSGVSSQNRLFLLRGVAALVHQAVAHLDGRLVLLEPGDLAAADDLHGVVDHEVPRASVGRADRLGRLYRGIRSGGASASGSSIRISLSACSLASVTAIPPSSSSCFRSHILAWST